MEAVVAVDVGGTSMKGWVCAADGSVVAEQARATPHGEAAIAAVRGLVADLASAARVCGAAVVVPGLVADGVARYSANIGWRDVPLRALLEQDLGVPVALDHDVRAGGLAELMLGAARGVRDALFVPIGTGIAAAVIIDGAVRAGGVGVAGELGHVAVRPDGEKCACGNVGCLEAYASGAAIARRYEARTGVARTAEEIASAPDEAARDVWREAVTALADGLAAATALLDPTTIVIGGGLAQAGDLLLAPLADELAARLPWRTAPSIVTARLGAQAGRIGAAILAWQVAGRPEVPAGWPPR